MNNQLQSLRTELNTQFPERKEVIHGALCALLASESVLLVGPPGTAKSALVRAVSAAFNVSYFEWLMSRFTVAEEVLGPISLTELQNDRFVRVTTGKLPEAHVAFLDEVGRAGSTILNALLSAMNERVFHNGPSAVSIPLISVFGATNSLLDEPEQQALLDRFLLMFEVQPLLMPSNLRTVMTSPRVKPVVSFDLATLRRLQAEVAMLPITDATVDAVLAIRDGLKSEGLASASDRRWAKSLKLVQAAAFIAGQNETTPEDLLILTDVLWRQPADRPKIARIVGKLSDPVAFQAREILDAARDTSTKVQALRNSDRKAYLNQAAQSLDELRAQQKRLQELGASAGARAKETISEATAEINGLHAELARAVSTGLGLGMRAVK
jgi:MoxR-like ATPase